MLDHLRGHHLSHVGTSGRIADHTGTATDEGDRLVACHLQTFHQAKCHEVTNVQAVCSRVKADIKGCFAFIYHFFDFFFICNLGDKTAGYQLFITVHCNSPYK